MNRLVLLAAAALSLAATGLAQAGQTIASPAIHSSSDQIEAICTIRNVGPTQVLVEVHIFYESGDIVAIAPAGDHCNGVHLASGSACSITATGIQTNFAYDCSATATSVKHLRGALFLVDVGNISVIPSRSAPLR